jgi:hypothetical protein
VKEKLILRWNFEYLYVGLCKHFPLFEIVSEWKHVQRCMTTHSKANNVLMLEWIKFMYSNKWNVKLTLQS